MIDFLLLHAHDILYQQLIRPLIFRTSSAQQAHDRILQFLQFCDSSDELQSLFVTLRKILSPEQTDFIYGGVNLTSPLMLAAGFVKGTGFESEELAMQAVQRGENIIPGWRTMPNLVGSLELGSYTRWSRMGNPGTVIWRDVPTHSTQNRVGLKNPGVHAAAEFLARNKISGRLQSAATWGINIAITPGLTDPEQQKQDALESIFAFLDRNVIPDWLTLNVSCPNTEDDPGGNQTENNTHLICQAAVQLLESHQIPLWVKISPDLSAEQYRILMKVFAETGVKAVIATNTLGQPTPDNPNLTAGVGGGRLHQLAVQVAVLLAEEKRRHDYPMDVIGCGGIQNASTCYDFMRVGVSVVQYISGLIYGGPLVAASILNRLPSG